MRMETTRVTGAGGRFYRATSRSLVALLILESLIGCAPAPVVRPAATTPVAPKAKVPGAFPFPLPPPAASVAPKTPSAQEGYRIGVGDLLELSLYRPDIREHDDLRRQMEVRPDGKISYFFVGDVAASGRTVEELREEIAARLRKYVKSPEVAVIVVSASKKRIYVVGEVMEQGLRELKTGQGDSVLDAIFLSKGLTKKADVDRAYVIRRNEIVPVELGELLLRGDRTKNVILQSEDVVYVPEALDQRVFVVGYVRRPNAFEISRPIRLTEAIALAEDFSLGARKDSVTVIRGGVFTSDTAPEVITVDMNKVRAGAREDVYVQRGDVVMVPATALGKWNEIMTQLLPSLQAILVGAVVQRQVED